MAFTNLQDALAAATSGDEIRVAAGSYRPDQGSDVISGDRLATFSLKSGVSVSGGFAGCGAPDPNARDLVLYETVLTGDLSGNDGPGFTSRSDNSYHVVTYGDPSATGVILDGFTIRGGHADDTGPAGTITNQGGGIHIRNGSVKCIPGGPTIRNCIIRDNWAAHHGAVNDHAYATVMENCTFRDNFAGEQGGGLLIHHGIQTVVRNCTFERNVTHNEGGGVWTGRDLDPSCLGSTSPSPSFIGCRFEANEGFNGGGLFAASFSSPVVSDCLFEGNVAQFQGGGVHLARGPITINNARFLNNSVVLDEVFAGGGGAWLSTGSPTTEALFSDCEFQGNSARTGGGIFELQNSLIRVTRGQFIENVAGNGGGLWYNGTAVVTDSMFLRNQARTLGGGLAADSGGRLTLSRSSLIENHVFEEVAGGGGGGMAMYGASAKVTSCWIIGNSVNEQTGLGYGCGGILINAGATASITNSAFVANSAWRGGGACGFNFSTVDFANCTFAGNIVRLQGSEIRVFRSALTIVNSILWNVPGNVGPVLSIQEDPQYPQPAPRIEYNCIRGGWSGTGNIDIDPGFVNVHGSDGVAGTADDDLRLWPDSPCIDIGDAASLPEDNSDLDGDGDVTEPIPFDLNDDPRMYGAGLDLGALETSVIPCDPGTFSATGEQPCNPCPPGTAQPNPGATDCPSCPAGTFASSPGTATCMPCPVGTYQPSVGAVSCTLCACEDFNPCTTNGCDAVSGECQNEPIIGCEIPTISEWGVAVLLLLLMTAGTVTIRVQTPCRKTRLAVFKGDRIP